MIARAQARGAPHLAPDVSARLLGAKVEDPGGAAPRGVGGWRRDANRVRFAPRPGRCGAQRADVGSPRGAGSSRRRGRGRPRRRGSWPGRGRRPVWAACTVSRCPVPPGTSSPPRTPASSGRTSRRCSGTCQGEREARGAVSVGENALIIVDEATMASGQDADALLRLAERENAQIRFIGDTCQLSSPEQGGAFEMLARKCGYAQLQEPVRFTDEWQRDASAQCAWVTRRPWWRTTPVGCAARGAVRGHGRVGGPRVPPRLRCGQGRADDCADERGDTRPVPPGAGLPAALGPSGHRDGRAAARGRESTRVT